MRLFSKVRGASAADDLQISPQDYLKFKGPFNRNMKQEIVLTNNSTSDRFCFKIKSNAPRNRLIVSPKQVWSLHTCKRINFQILPLPFTYVRGVSTFFGMSRTKLLLSYVCILWFTYVIFYFKNPKSFYYQEAGQRFVSISSRATANLWCFER